MPWQAFSMAVDAGPSIRDQTNVEDQLEMVRPWLRGGLEAMFERLNGLARGAQFNDGDMTGVTIRSGLSGRVYVVDAEAAESGGNKRESLLERVYARNPRFVQGPRSYETDRPRQVLRWMSTVLKETFPGGREVQAYFDREKQTIYVSSNRFDDNKNIRELLLKGAGLQGLAENRMDEDPKTREARHSSKLKNALSQSEVLGEDALFGEVLKAIEDKRFEIPDQRFYDDHQDVGLHAERRIKEALEADGRGPMNLDLLAGTRRACGQCAADLGFEDWRRRGPFWLSKAASAFLDGGAIIDEDKKKSVGTYVTRTRNGRLTTDYNTDSDSSSDELALPSGSKRLASGSSGRGEPAAGSVRPGPDSDVGSGGRGDSGVGGVKGKGVERSGAASVGESAVGAGPGRVGDPGGGAALDGGRHDQRDDLDPEQLDSMVSRWDRVPPHEELELDSGESYVVELIRRGVRDLPGDLADRFARHGVQGPRHVEQYWARQQNSQAGSSGHRHADESSHAGGSSAHPGIADSTMVVDAPGEGRSGRGGAIGSAVGDDDVEMADVSRDDDSDLTDLTDLSDLSDLSNRLRDNDFGGRRSQAPPTATFSERFEANTGGPTGKGGLQGWRTYVAYDQRRFQLADGSWVRDFEIRLGLVCGQRGRRRGRDVGAAAPQRGGQRPSERSLRAAGRGPAQRHRDVRLAQSARHGHGAQRRAHQPGQLLRARVQWRAGPRNLALSRSARGPARPQVVAQSTRGSERTNGRPHSPAGTGRCRPGSWPRSTRSPTTGRSKTWHTAPNRRWCSSARFFVTNRWRGTSRRRAGAEDTQDGR